MKKMSLIVAALVALCVANVSAQSPRVNLTLTGQADTTWESATAVDDFVYGGAIGLSLEGVIVDALEIGVRQSFSSFETASSQTTTTTVTTPGHDTFVTTYRTKPHKPKGHAYGWYKNWCKPTTTVVHGEDQSVTTTETTYTKDSELIAETSVFADYNLRLCRAVTLFAGGNTAIEYGQGTSPAYYAGPEGGVKVNLTDHVYALGRVDYRFRISDRDGNNGDGLRYSAGVGFRF